MLVGRFVIALAAFGSLVQAFKPEEKMPGVTELTANSFERGVTSKKNWLLFFYLPTCGWSREAAEEWSTLGGMVGSNPHLAIGKVNAAEPENAKALSRFGIRGYPTFILLKKDGSKTQFSGPRTAKAWMQFIGEKLAGVDLPDAPTAGGTGEVVVLSPKNWDAIVGAPDHSVFVKFFAPWCGHCKKMAGDWEQLARDQENVKDIVIAEVDCATYTDIGKQHGVQGYPTIKWFPKGTKEGTDYGGARVTHAFQAFIDGKK